MPELSRPRPVPFLTVANALTTARLVLLPVVIAGIALHAGRAVVIAMAVIVITDLLDGRIARRMGQASSFGGTLDSTIDFVLIYSIFIALYAGGRLATYQFAVLYIAMVSAFLLQMLSMAGSDVAAVVRTRSGKLTGALQYAYLLFLVALEVLPAGRGLYIADKVVFGLLTVSVVLSTTGAAIRLSRVFAAQAQR